VIIARPPHPLLRPFVARVWVAGSPSPASAAACRVEHLLPTGYMHVAFRLDDSPLRIRESMADAGVDLREPMIGGLRSRFLLRELSGSSGSVAAVLRPGAARVLFGIGADELAGRHTPLAELWGAAAGALRERLLAAPGAQSRLALLEAVLMARLSPVRGIHPAVAALLGEIGRGMPVAAAVALSGLSHRHFNRHFAHAVGVAPKAFQRLRRFQHALRLLRRGVALAAVAAEAGYSDQAHLTREFVLISGVTPAAYRRLRPAQANHLSLPGPGQVPSRSTAGGRGS
jgi:AraC-like DNA-binding protein